jgi:hypothetical protein
MPSRRHWRRGAAPPKVPDRRYPQRGPWVLPRGWRSPTAPAEKVWPARGPPSSGQYSDSASGSLVRKMTRKPGSISRASRAPQGAATIVAKIKVNHQHGRRFRLSHVAKRHFHCIDGGGMESVQPENCDEQSRAWSISLPNKNIGHPRRLPWDRGQARY